MPIRGCVPRATRIVASGKEHVRVHARARRHGAASGTHKDLWSEHSSSDAVDATGRNRTKVAAGSVTAVKPTKSPSSIASRRII